jgi:hypothetical protein
MHTVPIIQANSEHASPSLCLTMDPTKERHQILCKPQKKVWRRLQKWLGKKAWAVQGQYKLKKAWAVHGQYKLKKAWAVHGQYKLRHEPYTDSTNSGMSRTRTVQTQEGMSRTRTVQTQAWAVHGQYKLKKALAVHGQYKLRKAWAVHRQYKLTKIEKVEIGDEQSLGHGLNFLSHQWDCSQRIRHGRPVSQFRILLWRFTAQQTFHPKLWQQNNWLLHHNSATSYTSIFTRKFLIKNKMSLSPTHPTFLFPRLQINLKGRHFETSEVIEAGSQNMTSRMHLKKWQKRW